MAKSYFLMVIFVALILPCVEVPEWVTLANDLSNDFFLITSKPKPVSLRVVRREPAAHVTSAVLLKRFPASLPSSTSELQLVTGQRLLTRFSLLKR